MSDYKLIENYFTGSEHKTWVELSHNKAQETDQGYWYWDPTSKQWVYHRYH